MQAGTIISIANVHTGAFSNRIQSFKYCDIRTIVLLTHGCFHCMVLITNASSTFMRLIKGFEETCLVCVIDVPRETL
jgi:hypothetical protein